MTDRPLIVVPIRSFTSAKQRLSGVLDEPERRSLAMAMAERTIETALRLSDAVGVVTSDEAVGEWALNLGAGVIGDPGEGLDVGAATAARFAMRTERRWLIVHADIPTIDDVSLDPVIRRWPPDGNVIVPSFDGGTPILGGTDRFPFSYGPGSFHRHLAAMASRPHAVVASPSLAIDLDTPADLTFLRSWGPSSWIEEVIAP